MKILVTGGAGFIGSHMVKALIEQNHEVVVVDDLSQGKKSNIPKGVNFFRADIRDNKIINKLPSEIDAVFHLAAQIDVRKSVDDPAFDSMVNVAGTVALLDYAVKAGSKRFVYSSTGGAIYGEAETIPTPENSSAQSSSPYGIAKFCAEQYLSLFSRIHDLPTLALRYSNVYGPGQDGSKETGVIAIFSKLVSQQKPLTIYGDGEQTRDFVFVGDVVNANMLALNKNVRGVINVGTGVETSVNKLAEIFQEIVDYNIDVSHGSARQGEEARSCLDNKKAKQELGWAPSINLKKGLEITLESMK